eukprot:UN25071
MLELLMISYLLMKIRMNSFKRKRINYLLYSYFIHSL